MQTLLSVPDQAYRWQCRQRSRLSTRCRCVAPALSCHRADSAGGWIAWGGFRFGPLSVVTKADGEVLHLWSVLIVRNPQENSKRRARLRVYACCSRRLTFCPWGEGPWGFGAWHRSNTAIGWHALKRRSFFGIRKSVGIRKIRLLRSRLRAIWSLT